jgi:hypothetical protein
MIFGNSCLAFADKNKDVKYLLDLRYRFLGAVH